MTTRMFKSRFKKAIGEQAFSKLVFKIRDSKVNGVVEGAVGFINNPITGLYVYIDLTKGVAFNSYGYMYRYCEGFRDYSGNGLKCLGRNRWTKDENKLYADVYEMLCHVKQ